MNSEIKMKVSIEANPLFPIEVVRDIWIELRRDGCIHPSDEETELYTLLTKRLLNVAKIDHATITGK